MDGSSAERNYQIAFANNRGQLLGAATQIADVLSVLVTIALDAVGQDLGIHAVNRRLAGGVDVGYEQHVSIVKSNGKLIHQIIRPAIAMWLKQYDDAAIGRSDPCRAQGRFDLRGMVAIVVNDG